MIEIKPHSSPCSLFLYDVKDHYSFKSYFLTYLSNVPVNHFSNNSNDKIYKTDFYSELNYQIDNYKDKVLPIINNHCFTLSRYLNYDIDLQGFSIWYQQYAKGDMHGWHRHPGCTFSNIYYVDLPENENKTTFRFRDKEFIVDIKEGQILTFPSYLEHCSKPNPLYKFKTVIAFNSN
jgi:hypothetical protein